MPPLCRFLRALILPCSLAAFVALALVAGGIHAREIEVNTGVVENQDVTVRFEKPLSRPAEEMLHSYPVVKMELETALRRTVNFHPVILLIREGDTFRRIAGNDMIVAFAAPRQGLIVIDYSRMGVHPFTLQVTLKHELCHLLLHRRVKGDLPRWFDEGVSQWVTGGLAEIIMDRKVPSLSEAMLSQRLISLESLKEAFPKEKGSLALAYEESRGAVEYMGKTFGAEKILEILDHMERGKSFEEAFQGSLSITLAQFEEAWHSDLGKHASWFLFFANNIYEILFFFMALITAYAFLRLIIRRRIRARYIEEEDDESFPKT